MRRDARDLAPLLRLRLAPTAAADVVAAAALFGSPEAWRVALAALGSVCLYAGGMVQNDVADRGRDPALHPGRPLARRPELLPKARALSASLFLAGLLLAGAAGASFPAVAVVLAASSYNLLLKRWPGVDAVAMGLARAANLGIGVAVAGAPLLGAEPLLRAGAYGAFIAGVTLASRAEEAARPRALLLAGLLLSALGLALTLPRRLFALLPVGWILGLGGNAFEAGTREAAGRYVFRALQGIFWLHAASLAAAGEYEGLSGVLACAILTFLR
jgi:4-hydroxybenzoate polyprenyltransferase